MIKRGKPIIQLCAEDAEVIELRTDNARLECDNAELRATQDVITSIREQGYGVKLSCWMQGRWTCEIWDGSPVDRSENTVLYVIGDSMQEAVTKAKEALAGKEQK